jgi:hypothetical protein
MSIGRIIQSMNHGIPSSSKPSSHFAMLLPTSIYDNVLISLMSHNDAFQQPHQQQQQHGKKSSLSATTSSSSEAIQGVAMNCFGEMRRLPSYFIPGPYDVICARGKKALQHPGNITFRMMIQQNAEEYEKTSSKREKTRIVKSILSYFRERSVHGGGFVCDQDGIWYDVGDQMAREKCGQT